MVKYTILIFSLLLAGCASSLPINKQVALLEPSEGVSVPHPEELEKNGSKHVTVFKAVMNPALFTEMFLSFDPEAESESEKVRGFGVWPVPAMSPDGEMVKGLMYLTDIDFYGRPIVRVVMYASKDELEKNEFKMMYFTRGSGMAFTMTGIEVPRKGASVPEDLEITLYDPVRFSRDDEYKFQLFREYGISLAEMRMVWENDRRRKSMVVDSESGEDFFDLREFRTDDDSWEEFRRMAEQDLPFAYINHKGEKVLSRIAQEEEFLDISVTNPNISGGQRLMKHLKIPLIFVPSPHIAFSMGAGVVADAIQAGIDDDWHGVLDRATVLRQDLAPVFSYIVWKYQMNIQEKIVIIHELMLELEAKP